MDRRESLTLFAGAAAALAGCSGFASDSSESTPTVPGGEEPGDDAPSTGTETDPEALLVRADTDRQPLWIPDQDGGRPTPRREGRFIESAVLDSASRADRLSVTDAVDSAGVDTFLAETAFETETVYLETLHIEECFQLELCQIGWQPDRVSTDYARRGRPYDDPCAVDAFVFEARLIRIPDVLDADAVRGGSTSVGSGPCDQRPARIDAVGGGGSGTGVSGGTDADAPTGPNPAGGGER